MEPGDDPGELDRYRQEFDHYVESQSVVGTTLAPTAPVTLTPDGLLANLAKEVAQARALRCLNLVHCPPLQSRIGTRPGNGKKRQVAHSLSDSRSIPTLAALSVW